ncbi:MAG TPA: hypothetical protein VMX38_21330 [Verrucomicrobiae bacterium]|jgi:hypothetical protein|nr:hypothetical protein [Verrucomicrobiae bacterium]
MIRNHKLILGVTLLASLSMAQHAFAQKPVSSANSAKKTATTNDIPRCSDPLTTVAVPSAPHGLFVILFPGARINEQTSQLLHNPAVCGANFYVVWKDVDRGSGANPRYDWSGIERQIAPWIAAKKRVNFIIWATTYRKGDSATPEYVFAKVPSVTCPAFGHVPVFWNPEFMSSYQSFMRATIDKWGANPSVGYIRFGLGAGGEIYPACMFFMRDQGFSDATWQKYIFDMLDFEKSLNSPKQLAVGLNAYGEPPHLDFAAAVAERAVQDGIAIGNQGLTAEDPRNDAAGKPCMADWCRIFRQARGKVPLILQTGHPTEPDRSGEIGSLVDMLPFAVEQKVQIFELYPQDWLLAYDPYAPEYPQYHKEYQRVLEDAAKVLGGN